MWFAQPPREIRCDGTHQARLLSGLRERAGTILQDEFEGRANHARWLPNVGFTGIFSTKTPNTSVGWTPWWPPWKGQNEGHVPKLRMVARNRQSNRARVKRVHRPPTHPEQSQKLHRSTHGVPSTPLAAHPRWFRGTILWNNFSNCRVVKWPVVIPVVTTNTTKHSWGVMVSST